MRFAFGSCVLDPSLRELIRAGQAVAVEPQVFDLLHHLIRERHRVVSKDDLIEAIWGGRSVSDSTLSSRINAARKALGDTGREQNMIRTYPRRGVRFVGQVREEAPALVELAPAAAQMAADSPAGRVRATEAPLSAKKPVLVVLPFKNMSEDPEQQHLAEGVTQDIVTSLSSHRSLHLAAWSSDLALTGRAPDVRSIGIALNADYVVAGSLRKIGNRVRITAQLFETSFGRHLWAERYDLGLSELGDTQDETTAKIAARVEAEVGAAERLRCQQKPQEAFCAADYFQLGLAHFYRSSRSDNLEAQKLFRCAIELDPSLAQAYAFLSYSIVLAMVYFDSGPDEGSLEEAVEIARHGVELDDRDAMIRFAHGRAMLARRDYTNALAAMHAAIELNPTMAVVYCGLGDSLAYESRFAEAIPYFQKAIDLSPHDPQRWAFMSYRSLAHLFAGEFAQAAEWAQKATQVPGAHYWPYAHRVAALGHLQQREEVAGSLAELQRVKPGFSCAFARERLFFIKDPEHLETYVSGLRKAGLRD